jgi:hypothetical protein
MNSDQAHQRAERNFKKEERARDGRQAMIEYEVQVRATRAKTERLNSTRSSTAVAWPLAARRRIAVVATASGARFRRRMVLRLGSPFLDELRLNGFSPLSSPRRLKW